MSSKLRTVNPSQCLISFVGFEDPYPVFPPEDDGDTGPILALATLRAFDRIVLLSTPETVLHAERTEKELRRQEKTGAVEILHMSVEDPTDYGRLLQALRESVKPLLDSAEETEFFVATAGGTPQMHACWILLVAGGEVSARILQARRPRFARENYPIVTELDLSDAIFPRVQPEPGAVAAPVVTQGRPVTRQEAVRVVREVGILGEHPDLLRSIEIATTLAPYDAPLLLQGETGTGKELMAQLIHRESGRPAHLFIPVNCAALPAQLAESILFGHRKGAFTGATRDHSGRFQQADGGTLFLDEIGDLPLEIQAKLLRAIEQGEVEPLGSYESVQVNVRIIAATNRGLLGAIRQKEFRRDLFYRFGEVIVLPPLRERRTDIPVIAMAFLDRLNQSFSERRRFSAGALEKLRRAYWHGNVRDLQNVIERAAITCHAKVIEPEHIMLREEAGEEEPLTVPEPFEGFSMDQHISAVRDKLIQRAMALSRGNKSQAARLLGVTPQAVHKHLKQKNDDRDDTSSQ